MERERGPPCQRRSGEGTGLVSRAGFLYVGGSVRTTLCGSTYDFSDAEVTIMSMPETVNAPDLLQFNQTEKTWAEMSEDEKRDAVVNTLEQVVNFGHADSPPGRHAAYGDIIALGEPDHIRKALLEKTVTNSSCGLLVRSVWRLLGAKHPLLDPPYKPGSAITNLIAYAREAGALKTPTPDEFDPKKGDVLFILKDNHQHIFTVTDVADDGTLTSVDGGQIHPVVDDGRCNGIQKKERKLEKSTLLFAGDERKITYWIDVTALPFTEPIVELSKLMSDDDVK
jgi:hypothetical protein